MTSRKFLIDSAHELSRELDEEEGKKPLMGGGPGSVIPIGVMGGGLAVHPSMYGGRRKDGLVHHNLPGYVEGQQLYRGKDGLYYLAPPAPKRSEGAKKAAAKNPWVKFVKAYARDHGIKYGEALQTPGLSALYHSSKAESEAMRRAAAGEGRRKKPRVPYGYGYVYG